MTNFLALLRRELGVYFISPMAYVVLTALLGLSGAIFYASVSQFALNQAAFSFAITLNGLVWIIVVTSALITMRLIAEEKVKGTLEIILTAPVGDATFVLAKFAATMFLLAYLVIPTLGYPILISGYGPVDWGATLSGYVGVFLVGAVVYSIGLFISSLCSSQITAGIVTFTVSLFLLILNFLSFTLEKNSFFRPILRELDLNVNFGDFLKGVVDTSRLVYLASVVFFFLFLTTRVVESRRWR